MPIELPEDATPCGHCREYSKENCVFVNNGCDICDHTGIAQYRFEIVSQTLKIFPYDTIWGWRFVDTNGRILLRSTKMHRYKQNMYNNLNRTRSQIMGAEVEDSCI